MKTSIVIATLALLLAGCSTSSTPKSQDDPIVKALMNQTSGFVEIKLGLPNQREETRSGAEVWTYLDTRKGLAANECRVILTMRNKTVENVVVSTDSQSMLSVLVSSCDHIRKTLGTDS